MFKTSVSQMQQTASYFFHVDRQNQATNDKGSKNSNNRPPDIHGSSTTEVNTHCSLTGKPKYIFLATATVEVKNKFGQYIPCRALLDSASQSHFLSELCTVFEVTKDPNTFIHIGHQQCNHCSSSRCFNSFKVQTFRLAHNSWLCCFA